MNTSIDYTNEASAADAFTKQAAVFDELYDANPVIRYKRSRVREHVLQYLKPGSNILELNAGTGEDAIFFAERGHGVHATDISSGMQEKLRNKVEVSGLEHSITNEICSFTGLDSLNNKGPYDCIFSNFAGLNCTGQLHLVLKNFGPLLKSGGIVTLVILPKFCLWELLLVFKGKFKTATRRLFSANGRKAKIDMAHFTCWYYNPLFVVGQLKKEFDLLKIEGLCTIVPPSYVEDFAFKYPKVFFRLCRLEDRFKNKWPWKNIGDYYIISLQKK